MLLTRYSKLPGKIKGLYFFLKLHVIFGRLSNYLLFLSNIAKLSKWISIHKNRGFTNFYRFKFEYNDRLNLFKHII